VIVAPVFRVMLVFARISPVNDEVVPSVAELLTINSNPGCASVRKLTKISADFFLPAVHTESRLNENRRRYASQLYPGSSDERIAYLSYLRV
jgi:nucleoside recognition membrane protein YjiH